MPRPAIDLPAPAQPPRSLLVVVTRVDVAAILRERHGTDHRMASLRSGSGRRLMECLRARVKDLDFAYQQTTVRAGKRHAGRRQVLGGDGNIC